MEKNRVIGKSSFKVAYWLMSAPVISGPYRELAKMIREVTGDVPRQVAANRSGLSHDTIGRMWQGHRPSRPSILQFAAGYGLSTADANKLLKEAGYLEIAERGTHADNYPGFYLKPDAISAGDGKNEDSSTPNDEVKAQIDPLLIFMISNRTEIIDRLAAKGVGMLEDLSIEKFSPIVFQEIGKLYKENPSRVEEATRSDYIEAAELRSQISLSNLIISSSTELIRLFQMSKRSMYYSDKVSYYKSIIESVENDRTNAQFALALVEARIEASENASKEAES